MSEILDISDSSDSDPFSTEYLIDKWPRDTLDNIYMEAKDLTLVRLGTALLNSSDLERLYPGEWLNDKVIEAYLGLVCSHFDSIYMFSTHFYSSLWNKPYEVIRGWVGDINLLSYEYLLFPIHLSSHWTLAIVHGNTLEYYDSLGCRIPVAAWDICGLLAAILLEEYGVLKEYNVKNMNGSIPYQNNTNDCGVFCCMYARYRVDPVCNKFFTSNSVELLRKRMLHELLAGEIIYTCIE
ncbi:sentrin-specific protease 2 (axin associating molecule) [Pancytospora epiphaga]|nr:sentrin-specific protease 2 (axin associating molecule) [Pancytospora epiphaga]